MNTERQIFRETDPLTGDTCVRILHESGLEIRVLEQPAMHTAAAEFAVRYGSVHTAFIQEGKRIQTPAGVAHYLEHKLFENEDNGVSARFAAIGASDNAYTGFDRTVCHFRTHRAFPEALAVLLEFVQHPQITQGGVEHERGIITQEIVEYYDDADDRMFFQVLEALYHACPIRTDVAGTPESIAQITAEMLLQCHSAFYNLHNMVLSCAGNVTAAEVLETADRLLIPAPPFTVQPALPPEPETVFAPYRERTMAVGRTQFSLGFKSAPASGMTQMREKLICELAADLLTGACSPFYEQMRQSGLLPHPLSAEVLCGSEWFAVIFDGESDEPQTVADALCKECAAALQNGIDPALLQDLKRAYYRDEITAMQSPEDAAAALTENWLAGCTSPFARTALLAQITPEEICDVLARRFRQDRAALSVILPDDDTDTNDEK
ncbi:MAG TPA: insulinase family protein [Ruminococcus sp.]|nr:insulinase family protein [Ruminococcus sp.]